LTHKLSRALVAAGVTSVITLAATPNAHAGWMTGNQNPPIYTDNHPCRNGMAWSYATYVPGSWPPVPFAASREIHGHWFVLDTGAAPIDPPDPALVVSFTPTRTIPQRLLTLPPTFTGIPAGLYPPGRVNKFDYSADFTITFNRTLVPGWRLRTQWHEPPFWNVLFASARYRVQNCWLGTVRTHRDIVVRTREPQLAVAQLQPRKWYLDGGDLVLVYDTDLRYELGENVPLVPAPAWKLALDPLCRTPMSQSPRRASISGARCRRPTRVRCSPRARSAPTRAGARSCSRSRCPTP
jgi:hypothetical protein